ncbi:MAG: hypothetical protein JST08_06360 [Actinobacteria bacterium]|nr:hypothetical protein [Actinomycetota bacterium]
MSTNAIRIRQFVAVRGEETEAKPEGAASVSVETIAYWAVVASIYMGFGFLWYYSFKEKLFDDGGTMPAGLAKAYGGSFVDSFPGLNATWTILGIVEGIAFLGFIASIAAGEFLPTRRKPILAASLGVSLVTFALLIFGQQMIGEFESVAQLFGYFGATVVTLLLVQLLPPRHGIWKLAARAED